MSDVSLDDFTEEVTSFLDANAKPRVAEDAKSQEWGEGSDNVSLFAERTPEEERADVERAKAWRNTLFDAGFGWITGPSQYGGRELPASFERAYGAVEATLKDPKVRAAYLGEAA